MVQSKRKYCIYSGLILTLLSFDLNARAGTGMDQYDYPELSVAPRASERLQIEAEKESSRRLTTFLPMQLSGLATLVAGISSYDSNSPTPAYAGMFVGGGWFVISTVLAFTYQPYNSGWKDVSPLPKGSTREQLTRERAAEEEIKSIASVGEKLKWISMITELGAVAYMFARSTTSGSPPQGTAVVGPIAPVLQIAAGVVALSPLLFRFHWAEVADEQAEYKKRIYAPVAHATFFYDQVTRTAVPGVGVSLAF